MRESIAGKCSHCCLQVLVPIFRPIWKVRSKKIKIGLLLLSVTKVTYEKLGLVGQPSKVGPKGERFCEFQLPLSPFVRLLTKSLCRSDNSGPCLFKVYTKIEIIRARQMVLWTHSHKYVRFLYHICWSWCVPSWCILACYILTLYFSISWISWDCISTKFQPS